MKAAVLRELNEPLCIEEVQVDRPGLHEVLIRTGASGVCHSDVHHLEGTMAGPKPQVLGHEGAGTVEAVGDRVSYVRPGDRVIVCASSFCGHCNQCLMGRSFSCTGRDELVRSDAEFPRLSQGGLPMYPLYNVASYAEQMLVHENAVLKVEEDIPFEQLALLGCGVVTGLGAVLNTAAVEPGSTVAVIGCGGVGLNSVQGAVLAGAARIIAIHTVFSKLELARQFGATDVVDASTGDIVERVLEMTGGGVDYSFEVIGKKETAEQAIKMVARGGTATIVGDLPDDTIIEFDGPKYLRDRKIQGCSVGSTRFRVDMPRYIQFYLQGRLKPDELVSRRLKLEQVNDAFEYMKRGEVARSVITFA